MLDTLLVIVGLASPPLILAWAYAKAKKDSLFYGYTNKQVEEMNKLLKTNQDFDLDLEELSYTFRRDFNASIQQMRSETTAMFNTALDNIASR